MKQIVKLSLVALVIANSANATDADVAQLNADVNQKVEQIAQTGILPTSIEIEAITGDMVFAKVKSTELTVEKAVEKYELTPTLERYVKIKKAQADLAAAEKAEEDANKSNGAGEEPPK
ncbi:MAG: hypothetical protein HRT35_18830 [Algicola sp.]|nr:hypothetical protein [Algicola sp.]